MKKSILLLIFMLGVTNIVNSQFKQANEGLRPSTDKLKHVNSGIISPDLYTGTLSLSIPFYNYTDNDFDILLSLDYASNGCIANERSGILGPGWHLNVGGCITREIKGIPDERLDYNKLYGFYALHKSGISQVSASLNKLFRIFGYKGTFHNAVENIIPAIIYCTDSDIMSNLQKYDAEPDIFQFNFMGYTGKFHLGFNNTIHVYDTNVNSKDLKIEIEGSADAAFAFSAINIYTPDGYKYVFNCDRQSPSVEFSLIADDESTPPNDNKGDAVAWNLTKIVAPNGRQVSFAYESKKIINYRPVTFKSTGNCLNILYRLTGIYSIMNNAITNPINDSEHVFYQNVAYVPILKSISTDMSISMEFDYQSYSSTYDREQYYMFGPMRNFNEQSVRLTNIAVIDWDGKDKGLKQCTLSYKSNTNGAKNYYLDYLTISGEGKYSMDYWKWDDAAFVYPPNGTFSVDYWGYYNGKNNFSNTGRNFLDISIQNSDLNEIISSNNYRTPDSNYAICGMLSKITYPTGGHSAFEYEAHDYSKAVKRLSLNNFMPELINEINICGGLRIKSIKNYLNNTTVSDYKEFEYKDGNMSSGILLNNPRLRVNYSASLYNGSFTENGVTLWSSNFENFSKTHIEYSKITEKLPDGSRIEYNYTNSRMSGYMDTVIYNYAAEKSFYTGQYVSWAVSNSEKIQNIVAPSVSKQFIRGLLTRKDVFKTDADTIPLYSEINTFNNTYTDSFTYIPAYLIRVFGYVPVYLGVHNLYTATQVQYFDGVEFSKTNTYAYNSRGQIASITNTDSKANTYITEYKYVADTTHTAGIFADMIYYNLTGSAYLLSEKTYRISNSVTKLIGGKQYTYIQPNDNNPSLVRTSKVYSYNPKVTGWDIDIKNNLYDNFGNLIECEDRNGIKTSYIWGYNGLHLVAECNNVSIEQTKKVPFCDNIQFNPLSDGIYEQIRSYLPKGQITTFNYDGNKLTKVTDPSGKIITYSYDSNQYYVTDKKMKIVKDGKGNTLKAYYYHISN
ncbi:MAG: hypothetical protein LBP63_07420 [Prevotellaceae bacterium]|jgi:hypothetical protein|nr:hypothetical protein [Prevotellaceae bacterium]